MQLFKTRSSGFFAHLAAHMRWPRKQTRFERAVVVIHHFLIYLAVFFCGYLVAQVQATLK